MTHRQALVDLAANGKLVVPIAQTLPLSSVAEGVTISRSGHPGGKLALVVGAD